MAIAAERRTWELLGGFSCRRGSALRHGRDTRGWAAQTCALALGSLAAPAALGGGAEPIYASFPEKPPSPWQPRASHGSPGSAACHPARRLAAPARCRPRDARDAGGAAVPWGARAATALLPAALLGAARNAALGGSGGGQKGKEPGLCATLCRSRVRPQGGAWPGLPQGESVSAERCQVQEVPGFLRPGASESSPLPSGCISSFTLRAQPLPKPALAPSSENVSGLPRAELCHWAALGQVPKPHP